MILLLGSPKATCPPGCTSDSLEADMCVLGLFTFSRTGSSTKAVVLTLVPFSLVTCGQNRYTGGGHYVQRCGTLCVLLARFGCCFFLRF